MFCGNCGTENANGAKFCKGCGKPLGNAGNRDVKIIPNGSSLPGGEAGVETGSPAASKVGASQLVDKIKAVPKKGLIGVCAAIIAIIVIVCIVTTSGKTIKLDKYLVVETEGYNGYGTARVSVDWDAIEAKYGSKLSFTGAAKNEYGGLINMMTPIDAVRDSVSLELEENSGLSNGDVIPYTWEVDEDLSKYVKCKIKYKNDKFTVSGLTEVGTFDAFADLSVEFSGVAPNGSVSFNYTGSEMNGYDFSCDKTSGLSNGDTIKVTIDDSRVEYYAQNLGKVPVELEKEFKVEGLESFLSKIAEIDDASMKAMQQQATDVYNANVAKSWGEGEKLETLTYIGDYLLTVKNTDSWGNNNFLFLVYKAQVRNTYSNDKKKYNKLNDIYWYIRYDNLMVEPDGKVSVDVTAYSTPGDRFTIDSGVSTGWWGTQTWYYYGYQTLGELYKNVVTVNMDLYNYEDHVDESVAPATVQEEVPEIEDVTAENGYILPNSEKELLTKDDLEGLTAEECEIARNEIYARHGRKFKDAELQAYFDACDWYEGSIEPGDFSETDLSDIEIANRDLIVEYEEENGYR